MNECITSFKKKKFSFSPTNKYNKIKLTKFKFSPFFRRFEAEKYFLFFSKLIKKLIPNRKAMGFRGAPGGGGGRGGGGGFGGRGGGGGFGGGRGGGGRGGGGGGRGGFGRRDYDEGPPERVVETGVMMHPCEDQIILKSTNKEQVPFFNAPIFLENKTQVGKVDEIFGQIKEYVNFISI
jgi:hypothetical protein